ncbi:MAG: histidinol-phosphate transaminase [Ilumatobacteraceae bacterium]|nr:histidinol-phosphate transaminase [Ilumatobacteraceae bacterium]
MDKYHSPQVDVAVRLNTNESPLPVPPEWITDVRNAVDEVAWNRYPDRSALALRQAIANRHGVSADNVFVANGSNEVLQTLLLTYAGAGRTVATFEPTYQMHAHLARISGATVVSGQRDSDFELQESEIRRVLDTAQPEVVFLCSPNNPTGRLEPRRNIELVVANAPGLVVIDEAYAEFSDWSALELVTEHSNVVVTRTFSKTWSLAALRLGYAIAPTRMVEELNTVVMPYHLDALKQIAGERALRYVEQMQSRVAGIVQERGRIAGRLGELGIDTWPSGANFILFRPTSAASSGSESVWQKLLNTGILVRDCSTWAGLDGCLRVTVGTPAENDLFLKALSWAVGKGE